MVGLFPPDEGALEGGEQGSGMTYVLTTFLPQACKIGTTSSASWVKRPRPERKGDSSSEAVTRPLSECRPG
jgi:hypothetical protein